MSNLLKQLERARRLEKIRGKAKTSSRQLGLFGNGNGNGSHKAELPAEVAEKLPMPHLLQQQVNRIWRLLPPAARTADDMGEYLAGPEFSDLWEKEYRTNVDVKENRRKAEAIFDYLLGVADAHDVTVLTLLDEYNVSLEPIHGRTGLSLPTALSRRLRKIVSTPLERAALEAAENNAADTQDMLTLAGVAERAGQSFLAGTIRETPLKEGKAKKAKQTRKASKPKPKTGAPTKHRASELADMESLLENAGFEKRHALTLRAEGMGPTELNQRLRVPANAPGSLEYTHGLQRSPHRQVYERDLDHLVRDTGSLQNAVSHAQRMIAAGGPEGEWWRLALKKLKKRAAKAKPRPASKAAAADRVTDRERSMLAIMHNALEARDEGGSAFGSKAEKAVVRKLIKRQLAALVRTEPGGPEGPWLWVRITPRGQQAIGRVGAPPPPAPYTRQQFHELVDYTKRSWGDAQQKALKQLRKLLDKWPELAPELPARAPEVAALLSSAKRTRKAR